MSADAIISMLGIARGSALCLPPFFCKSPKVFVGALYYLAAIDPMPDILSILLMVKSGHCLDHRPERRAARPTAERDRLREGEGITVTGAPAKSRIDQSRRPIRWALRLVGRATTRAPALSPAGGKVGLLGISLGAKTASAASTGHTDIDALVPVDGGVHNGYSQQVDMLPPLLLIWGIDDQTFPLFIAAEMERTAQRIGVPVSLDVYQGAAHDFFLRSGTNTTAAAHQSAASYLAGWLL
jgi:dienelactone hydrolase